MVQLGMANSTIVRVATSDRSTSMYCGFHGSTAEISVETSV
jgi:hypothetical protein